MSTESIAVDGAAVDETCVDHPLGLSIESVTNLEGDAQRTPETERTTSPDTKDVPYKGDSVGKSSNIVTYMKTRLRCQKPAAMHDTPYTDSIDCQRHKDMTKGMTGAETACASSDPCEGKVDPEVLDVQLIEVEGSGMGQVLIGYITTPLPVMELELLNNIRSRYKELRPNSKQCNVLLCVSETFTLEEDLKECTPKLVPANWLRGLINVVPKARVGDRSGRYCIGNLATNMFAEFLHRR
ncbi:LOW QUALITY PROTEIN: hypothetical protein Cgig2_002275 [Carnegiea gigantea]|uniref:Uncharacterized protein n=1 Tax=Carnegiea gigantea TaxID=171969 RepID=A0A9Q1KV70_9CARY|nr:LOW QUALITY PROTEIN: hypothetical protein Cgig2_002275 [Carnegiea gigantea]